MIRVVHSPAEALEVVQLGINLELSRALALEEQADFAATGVVAVFAGVLGALAAIAGGAEVGEAPASQGGAGTNQCINPGHWYRVCPLDGHARVWRKDAYFPTSVLSRAIISSCSA